MDLVSLPTSYSIYLMIKRFLHIAFIHFYQQVALLKAQNCTVAFSNMHTDIRYSQSTHTCKKL